MTPETPVSFHPLSLGQQALWFLYQMAPESVAYNIFDTAVIRSNIDIKALQSGVAKNCQVAIRFSELLIPPTKENHFKLFSEQLEVPIQDNRCFKLERRLLKTNKFY